MFCKKIFICAIITKGDFMASKESVSNFLYKFLGFAAFVVAIVVGAVLSNNRHHKDPTNGVQDLNYAEVVTTINNPDQGFYQHLPIKVSTTGVMWNDQYITDEFQLYHLRLDISDFSQANNTVEDLALTQDAVDGIEDVLQTLKIKNKNAILRFCYAPNFGSDVDKEPSMQMISTHIVQICEIANKFETTITAIEAGLIGPWGEMHSSALATSENINTIIQTFLNNTTNTYVLVRTPKMIYDYFNITTDDLENATINPLASYYRLGLFNDAFLSTENDMGTYTNREKEIAWISQQISNHLPYGGEVLKVESSLNNIENCLTEMKSLHLSYLNKNYDAQVVEKWKNTTYDQTCGNDKVYYGQTAYDYIKNHMGYRFVLTQSTIQNDTSKINIKLDIKNVGFGSLNRAKDITILFVDETGKVAHQTTVGKYAGEKEINVAVTKPTKNGKYTMYVALHNGYNDQDFAYHIQFANNLWDNTLKANKIGSISI